MRNKNSLFIRMLDNTNINSSENVNNNITNNNDSNNTNNTTTITPFKITNHESKKKIKDLIKISGIEYEQYFNYYGPDEYHIDPDDYAWFDNGSITHAPHNSFLHSFLQNKNNTCNINIPEKKMINTTNNGKTISNMITMNNENDNTKTPKHTETNNNDKFTRVTRFTIKDVVIDEKIDTVEDLINIIDKYPYNPFYKYNFNL